MKFFTISLFPNMIEAYTSESILGRAQNNGFISVKNFQLREFSKDKHRRTDGIAYGGGPGMVIWVDPIINNFELILKEILKDKKTKNISILVVNFVPSAKVFTNVLAKDYSKKYTHIVFICGRYEGIDARVNDCISDILSQKKKEINKINKENKASKEGEKNEDAKKSLKNRDLIKFNFEIENISVGEFVLTGGEVPAMLMIDAISRQVSGVLNDENSIEENRVASSEVYARPEIYEKTFINKETKKKMIKKYIVPKVLLSGNHKEIEKWREMR